MATFFYNHSLFELDQQTIGRVTKKRVEQNIKLLNQELDTQLQHVSEQIMEGDFSFSHLSEGVTFPVYVFEGKEMVFWSTKDLALHSTLPITKGNLQFIQMKGGDFLYKKFITIIGTKIYTFIGFIPLKTKWAFKNSYLKDTQNEEVFGATLVDLYAEPNTADTLLFEVGNIDLQHTLFYLKPIRSQKRTEITITVWISLLVIGFVLLLFYVLYWIRYFGKRADHIWAIMTLVIFLFAVRYFMIASDFPNRYFDLDLFKPINYASSGINSSLGDLFLNLMAVLILFLYVFILFLKTGFKFWLEKTKEKQALILTVVSIAFSFYMSFWCYDLFYDLFLHSRWNYDITETYGINQFKVTYALLFIQVSVLYFGVNHIVFRLVSIFDFWNKTRLSYILISVSTFFISIHFLFGDGNSWIILVHGMLLFFVHQFKLYKNFKVFRYQTYLYFILTSIAISFIVSLALLRYSNEKAYSQKLIFAEELINHHDFQGAYLLHEIAEQVKRDDFIKNVFTKPFSSKQTIAKKIRKIYFNDYFDKYDIKVSVYDLNGSPYRFNHLQGNYNSLLKKFNKEQYFTEHEQLYFVNSFKKYYLSKYLQFIDIHINGFVIGHVIIDLTLKKANTSRFLPRLLQSENNIENNPKEFDYAIFENRKLLFSKGEYNYLKFFDNIDKKSFVELSVSMGGFDHFISKSGSTQYVVVSSPESTLKRVYTNFSYLFLLLTVMTFGLVLFGTFYLRAKDRYFTFSSKVQTYLNIAYFTPLIIVSVVTTGILSTTFQRDLIDSLKDKAENLNENFTIYLEQYLNDEINFVEFNADIKELSKNSNTDINLYNREGHLITSTQTLIYETSLLGRMVNPEVMKKIIDQSNSFIHLQESIGEFEYSSIYLSVLSPNSNELIGIIGIPFFDASENLDEKKITVLTSIMNIFTMIFILILIVSYVAFKNLTDPLKLVAGKLKRTSFSGKNEQLEWQGNDEIGILITEYNAMIKKLEESKDALSAAEKESAWKEMAQQVAHEIKNPLTPMKLKLQFLRRKVANSDDEDKERTVDSLDALLLQVDTLSDIATSFSSFAKMPTPIIERFNIVELLEDISVLYRSNNEFTFLSKWDEDEVFVKADSKLFGRILTNLILNGKQAASSEVRSIIQLKMNIRGQYAFIEVHDNGQGIPEEIQHKVFLPNFSTKYTGSGIGLAMAKRGIEHAGGEIWFETDHTKGTIFYIKLPLD